MKKWITRFVLTGAALGVLLLSGCGAVQKIPESGRPSAVPTETEALETTEGVKPSAVQTDKEAADTTTASGSYWLIQVSDTKNFTYSIPVGDGGSIAMTATLHFIAWKEGGEDMYGKYEGRALVALDMDFSKAGAGGVTYTGGVMDDSISDNISFELRPAQQETVTSEDGDLDIAPLVTFLGQADIMTDEYTMSQQTWQALADDEVKVDVNNSFGDGTRLPQGFTLKAGQDSALISVGDLTAAYGLEAFSGTITKSGAPTDAISWFRDKVISRMEDRLSSSAQSGSQQPPESGSGDTDGQSGFTTDSEGREGMDTNGDGKLDIYFGKDGEVLADFDGDGTYEVVGEDGSDMG